MCLVDDNGLDPLSRLVRTFNSLHFLPKMISKGSKNKQGQVRSIRNRSACMIRCMHVDEARGVCKDRRVADGCL